MPRDASRNKRSAAVLRLVDIHGSEATTKNATVALDTDVNGKPDAFNPAELLAAVAA